jgi:lysyl-tRNA synthetase, class II
MMDFTEELLTELAEKVLGKPELTWKGEQIDLKRPWRRYTIKEALEQLAEIPKDKLETVEGLIDLYQQRDELFPPASIDKFAWSNPPENIPPDWYGRLLFAAFEVLVEEKLQQPTFITDHPVEVSPLAKQRPDDPRFTERFELYIAGMEMANGFSELNDPDVQAERFHQQVAAREKGDAEAHLFDHDYIRALEHAMPPAAGIGIGIDRLTMLFTDRQSIRDVILFPLMRPE